jgi:hypothetical protein
MAGNALVLGRILFNLQVISQRITCAPLTPWEAVKLQALLLAMLEEMERRSDD